MYNFTRVRKKNRQKQYYSNTCEFVLCILATRSWSLHPILLKSMHINIIAYGIL